MCPRQGVPPIHSDDDLSITTSTGILFVFDLGCNELLVFGRSGSEVILSATDLKELAFQLRQPRFARLLTRLIS